MFEETKDAFIILGILCSCLFLGLFLIIEIVAKPACVELGIAMKTDTKFSIVNDCMIKVDDKYIPQRNLRINP